MNTDPKKWNPFKFLRGAGRKSERTARKARRTANRRVVLA